jgi:hypothetical protein
VVFGPNITYDVTVKYYDSSHSIQVNYITINANFTDDGPTPLVRVTHVDSWYSMTLSDMQTSTTTNPGNACEMKTVKELKEFIVENRK